MASTEDFGDQLLAFRRDWLRSRRRIPFRAFLAQRHRDEFKKLSRLSPAERARLPRLVRLSIKLHGAPKLSFHQLEQRSAELSRAFLERGKGCTFEEFLQHVWNSCITEAELNAFLSARPPL